MTLYDLLESLRDNKDELTNVLITLDAFLKYFHEYGYCIIDFDPKKIILFDGKLTVNSFRQVLEKVDIYPNSKQINIFQNCKIGITSYSNMPINGSMNQEHYNLVRDNLKVFKDNIPSDIYEYYEEVFLNSNITYLGDYLQKKKMEASGNQNTNVMRKTLSTEIGRAFVNNDEAAYVKILFIPSLLVFTYILSLILYFLVF